MSAFILKTKCAGVSPRPGPGVVRIENNEGEEEKKKTLNEQD